MEFSTSWIFHSMDENTRMQQKMTRNSGLRGRTNDVGTHFYLRTINAQSSSSSRRRLKSKRWYYSTMSLLCLILLCLYPVGSSADHGDWIDPDTPKEFYETYSYPPHDKVPPPPPQKHHKNNKTVSPAPTETPTFAPTYAPTMTQHAFELVFSDEFEVEGRSFEDGTDPRWTALNKNDYTNDALHYYSPSNAFTKDGALKIVSEAADTDVVGYDDVKRKKTHVTKHFKSAMVQSWNKFCFTGGIIEAKVRLPGKARIGGLWPAFWILGNLARHTYVGSSEHVWPWSATTCTAKSADSQLLNACKRAMHYGLHQGVGRGAPEIDIFEVQPGNVKANNGVFLRSPVGQPFMSASFQVAPGRPVNRPGPGYWPGPGQWYKGLEGGNRTALNIGFYGNYNHFRGDYDPKRQDYWSDAISYNRQLDNVHFEEPHVYRLEWDVPSHKNGGGYLRWYLDGELVVKMDGAQLTNSSVGAEISSEPSSIILNTAISSQWGFPNTCPVNCPCKTYDCHSNNWKELCGFSEGFCSMMTNPNKTPPTMEIHWIRVYQDPNDPRQKVGCSTPERPTRKYIEAHQKLYKQEEDLFPLRGIQRGRGTCVPGASKTGDTSRDACGGIEHGRCTQGRVCECAEGWTGPHCLAHDGRDPIPYDLPDTILDVGFVVPSVAPIALLVVLCVLLLAILLVVVTPSLKHGLDGWTPIPNVIEEEQDKQTISGSFMSMESS